MSARNALALILAATSYATPSIAGVGFEIFGGARDGKMAGPDTSSSKKYDVKGNDFGLSLVYSPARLPFSFGLLGSYYTMDSSKAYKDNAPNLPFPSVTEQSVKGKITGMNYGVITRAWLPLGFIQPYLEAGYVMGSQKEKIEYKANAGTDRAAMTLNESFDTAGPLAGAGVKIAPTPLFAISVGYQMTFEDRKMKKADSEVSLTSAGGTISEKENITLTSDDKKARAFTTGALRLGFSLGF